MKPQQIRFPAGTYYVSKQSEIVDTLFNPSGTASGYYKRYKRRIQFFNLQGIPVFALINNQSIKSGEQPFLVSCSQDKQGRTVYAYSLCSLDSNRLGVPAGFQAGREFASALWEKATAN